MRSSAAAKEPRRKYLRAASAERALPRRKPVIAYTPSDMVSSPRKSMSMSLALESSIAPADEKVMRE